MQLRTSPSGPFLKGANIDDVLLWKGDVLGWQPGPVGGGAESAFDFIVESLDDLPAPVGGVITLVDGSYAFKASIDIGSNVLSIPTGTTVLLKGMGGFGEKVLSGDDTRVLILEGSAYLETLDINATSGTAIELATNASLTSRSCQFTGVVAGATMSAGLWRDTLGRITGGAQGIILVGGSLEFAQTRVLGGTNPAIDASGANVLSVVLEQCQLSADSNVVSWDCPSGSFQSVGTELSSSAVAACFLNLTALSLQFIGGKFTGNGGEGIFVNGNITRMLQVIGVQGFDLAAFIEWSSGAVRQATVQGCATFSDVAIGVNWTAADLPTLGLSLVGNIFDTATPLVGFTSASARANSKANVGSAGLLSETAIVP